MQPWATSFAWSPCGAFLALVVPSQGCVRVIDVTSLGREEDVLEKGICIIGEFHHVLWSRNGACLACMYSSYAQPRCGLALIADLTFQ